MEAGQSAAARVPTEKAGGSSDEKWRKTGRSPLPQSHAAVEWYIINHDGRFSSMVVSDGNDLPLHSSGGGAAGPGGPGLPGPVPQRQALGGSQGAHRAGPHGSRGGAA